MNVNHPPTATLVGLPKEILHMVIAQIPVRRCCMEKDGRRELGLANKYLNSQVRPFFYNHKAEIGEIYVGDYNEYWEVSKVCKKKIKLQPLGDRFVGSGRVPTNTYPKHSHHKEIYVFKGKSGRLRKGRMYSPEFKRWDGEPVALYGWND